MEVIHLVALKKDKNRLEFIYKLRFASEIMFWSTIMFFSWLTMDLSYSLIP